MGAPLSASDDVNIAYAEDVVSVVGVGDVVDGTELCVTAAVGRLGEAAVELSLVDEAAEAVPSADIEVMVLLSVKVSDSSPAEELSEGEGNDTGVEVWRSSVVEGIEDML